MVEVIDSLINHASPGHRHALQDAPKHLAGLQDGSARVPPGSSPARRGAVTLNLSKPAKLKDGTPEIYLDVLNGLLGNEMRKIIREELSGASIRDDVSLNNVCKSAGVHPRSGVGASPARNDACVSEAEQVICSALPEEEFVESTSQKKLYKTSYYHSMVPKTDKEERHGFAGRIDFSHLHCCERFVRKVDAWAFSKFAKVGTMEAPGCNACFKGFLEGWFFGTLVNMVVLLNVAFMVRSVDSQISQFETSEAEASMTFFWVDVAFLSFYSLEFLLKLACYGRYFFVDVDYKENWLDVSLLAINIASVSITAVTRGNQARSLAWVRCIRMVRVMKSLRVMRLALYFKSLRAILASMLGSVSSLFWAVIMLNLIFFVFSLVLVTRVADFLRADVDSELNE